MSKIHPKNSKWKRIKALRCYEMVREMLQYGYPAPQVADFIKEQGEYDGVSKRSLVVMLNYFRTEEILPAGCLTNRMPHIILDAKKQYTDKLEELRRMETVLEAMMYRFDLAHARERHYGILDPEARATGREIVDIAFKMFRVKQDLGITGAKTTGTFEMSPERIEEIRAKHGNGAAGAFADPVARARMVSLFKAIQDAATYDESREMGGEIIDVQVENVSQHALSAGEL